MSRVLLETTQPAFWENDAAGRRAIGRIAGILFSAGGLATVPAYRLMENPSPPLIADLLPFLAVVSGILCFVIPWDRLRPAWFHLLPALGTLEVAFSVWTLGAHGNVVSWFYVFVVVFAALAFCERLSVMAHVVFASAALAAPIVYMPESARDNLVRTLVALPTLVVAAAVVTFLRERLAPVQVELNADDLPASHGEHRGARLLDVHTVMEGLAAERDDRHHSVPRVQHLFDVHLVARPGNHPVAPPLDEAVRPAVLGHRSARCRERHLQVGRHSRRVDDLEQLAALGERDEVNAQREQSRADQLNSLLRHDASIA